MSSVDKRIVEMEFDNRQFEQGIAQSTSSLEGFSRTVLNTAGDGALIALGSSAEAIGGKFSAMGVIAATVLHNITNSAYNAATALAKSMSTDQISAGMAKYEQKTANVQTIMNATGESIEQVNAHLERLMWFSDETSFGFVDMTQALATMATSGGDVADIIPTLEGMANAVAFAGKGAGEYQRAIGAITRSYSAGHMGLLEMKTLSGAGVMSKQLKQVMIDAGVANKTIKKGQVTLENFDTTLAKKWATRDVLEQSLGKFAEFSSAVYEGVKSKKFKNAADGIAQLESQYDPLIVKAFKAAQSAKTFTEAIGATKDAVSSGWLTTFELIFGNLEEATALWTGVTELLWDIFASGSEKRNEMFEDWREVGGREGLIRSFVNIYNILGHITYQIKEAFGEAFGVMDSSSLINATKALENWSNKVLDWGKVSSDGTTRFEKIGRVFKGLFEILAIGKTVVKGIWGIFKDFLKGIGMGSLVDNGLTTLASLTDKIEAFHEKVKAFFAGTPIDGKGIGESIKGIFTPLKEIAEGPAGVAVVKTGTFLTKIVASIKEFLKGMSGVDIAGILFLAFGGLIIFKVVRIITSFSKGITDIKSSIVELIDNLSGSSGSGISDGIVKIAGALSVIAGAIALLGGIAPDRLVASMISMGILMVGIVAMVMMLRKIPFKDLIKLGAQSTVLVVLGVAINLFALALVEIGKLEPEQMVSGIIGLGLVLLQVIAFMKLSKGANVNAFKGAGLILVAVAMNMFAKVVKTIGSLSFEAVIKGIIGLTAVLFLVTHFINSTQKMNLTAFDGVALILIAASMNQFGKALKTIGSLPLSSIIKGIVGLGAVMTMIVIFIKATQDKSITNFKGATLLGIAIAINLFARALVSIGEMDTASVIKGVVGLGAVMTMVVIFIKATQDRSIANFKGATLIGIAIAINLFARVISSLGKLSIGTILKGVIGLGLVLLEVALFLKVIQGMNISAFDGFALIGLAISMNLFGLAIKAIGSLPFWDILKGVVGLGLVMFELAVFLKILERTKVGGFKAGALIALGLALNLFAFSLSTIGKLKVSQILKGVLGLGLVMFGLVVFLKAFSKLSIGKVGKAVLIMALLGVVMVGYALLFNLVKDLDSSSMIGFAASLSISLLAMSAAMLIIGSLPATLMLAGIAKLALIGLIVIGLMAAFGGLQQALNLSSYIDSFGDLLHSVGSAIGRGLSGLAEGLLSGLPAMGTSLGDFMTNAQPFFDGIAKLDSSQLDNAKTLAGVIIQIGRSSVISAITRFITGASAMETFAKDMAVLGEGLAAYATSTKGFSLSADDTTAATNAAMGIADLANAIPPSGGIQQILDGTKELGDFVTQIPKLGLAMQAYVEAIAVIQPSDEGKIALAAQAAAGIAQLANAIPPKGGIEQIVSGTQELGTFINDIPTLGLALQAYVVSIKDITAAKTGSITNAKDAAMGIADVANAIPRIGGIADVFAGTRDLVAFSEKLEPLGVALNNYVDAIKDIKTSDKTKIGLAQDAAMGIANLANAIPRIGGIADVFAGTRDLVAFSGQIPTLGEALGEYAKHISGFDKTVGDGKGAIEAAQGIAAVVGSLSPTGGALQNWTGVKSLADLSKDIPNFGVALGAYASGISSFSTLKEGTASAASAAATSIAAVVESLAPTGGYLQGWTGVKSLAGLSDDIPDFAEALKSYAGAVSSFDNVTADQSNAALAAATSIAAVVTSLPPTMGLLQGLMGVKSLGRFSKDIKPFGEAMKEYITQVASFPSITTDQSTTATDAAASIAAMATALPPTMGLAQVLFGMKSLSLFSKDIPGFGRALVAYITAIADMTTFDKAKSDLAKDTAEGLVSVLEKLPKSGGLDQFIGGARSLANFGSQLPAFGEGLKSYAESITGFSEVKQDDIDNALATAKGLNQFTTELQVTGDWLDWLTGTQELGQFGDKAGQLGDGLKKFIEGIGNVDEAKATTAISVMGLLQTFTGTLATSGGMVNDIGAYFGGTQGQTLLDTAKNMASVGTNLGLFSAGVKDIDKKSTDGIDDMITMFVDLTNSLEKSGGLIADVAAWFTGEKDLAGLGVKMGTFGMDFETFTLGISNAAGAMENFTSVKGIIEAFSNLSNQIKKGEIDTKAMVELGVIFGVTLTDEISTSIQNGNDTVVDSAKGVIKAASDAISTKAFKDPFIEAGKSFSDGIAEGIAAHQSKAVNAAIALAKATLTGVKGPKGLDMGSPPKQILEAGKLFVTGFADTIKNTTRVAIKAVNNLGTKSVDAFDNAMDGGGKKPYVDPATLPGFMGYSAGLFDGVKDFVERTKDDVTDKVQTGFQEITEDMFLPVQTEDGTGTTTTTTTTNRKKVIAPVKIKTPVNYLGTVGKGLTQSNDNEYLGEKLDALGQAVTNMRIVMDGNLVVGQIKNEVDRQLGLTALYKGRS